MSWFSFNQYPVGSNNQRALGSFNQSAMGAFNQAAGSANQMALGSLNQMAVASANQMAVGSLNQMALPLVVSHAGPGWLAPAGGQTGAGSPSGTGFLGGYGPVARSDYATPANLAPIPWALDFSIGNGWKAFPTDQMLNPYGRAQPLEWRTGDWDPGLRFWTLPFDPHLTEWLQDLDLSSPAVMAAREFAGQCDDWLASDTVAKESKIQQVISRSDLGWQARAGASQVDRNTAWQQVRRELVDLKDQMEDDRDRFLGEAAGQSFQMPDYFLHLLGIDIAAKPWTVALMNCGSAIGNMVKMQYKSVYRRVRPSTLCAGLVPPWGPPQHPSFPSGHSIIAHLYAMLLLEIPQVAERLGIFSDPPPPGDHVGPVGRKPTRDDYFQHHAYGDDMRSPLLWMAWRVARGRERIGVHYPSDSSASRHLAAALWLAMLGNEAERQVTLPEAEDRRGAGQGPIKLPQIRVPSLLAVLEKARAEWA